MVRTDTYALVLHRVKRGTNDPKSREKFPFDGYFAYFGPMRAHLEDLLRDPNVTDVLLSTLASLWVDRGTRREISAHRNGTPVWSLII